MSSLSEPYDENAEAYDSWYDSSLGQTVLAAELSCFRSLPVNYRGRWLEVGVGSGRFAAGLGLEFGLDPALSLLQIAASRGRKVAAGEAEALPWADNKFAGILITFSLCFFSAPLVALEECKRVLGPEGKLVVGSVPAESAWGRLYNQKKQAGEPFYAEAEFRTSDALIDLVESVGFNLQTAASTLFWEPTAEPPSEPRVETGRVAGANCVGFLFSEEI